MLVRCGIVKAVQVLQRFGEGSSENVSNDQHLKTSGNQNGPDIGSIASTRYLLAISPSGVMVHVRCKCESKFLLLSSLSRLDKNCAGSGQNIEEKTRPYRGGQACLYGV